MKNQSKSTDWEKHSKPIANLKEDLDWFFLYIKSGKVPSWWENVFYRRDWNDRTAVGADIAPATLDAWVHDADYKTLMDRAGIYKYDKIEEEAETKLKTIVADKLGLKEETVNVYCHNEPSGHMFPMHLDRNKWGKFSLEEDTTYNPNYGLFIIFFDDWQHGQAFQMGERFLSWKSGDVFTWNHESTPHGSCNFGYEDRFTLLVNGEYK